MTLKRWVLGKVNATAKPDGGAERRRVATSLGHAGLAGHAAEPHLQAPADKRRAAHLGPYAALISAIRDELEHFVASELRLHLAIAERDRYVLTSIEVEAMDSGEHRDLLRRFMAEFKPEQIKQYLAREVIAGLRNASAIDLTQFGGLNAATEVEARSDEDEGYDVLLEQLRAAHPEADRRPYEVALAGRWSQSDGAQFGPGLARPASAATDPHPAGSRVPEHPASMANAAPTPLAMPSHEVQVQDANGTRTVELAAVPGRRYVIGKDPGCDIVIDAVYASRRHCELWFDQGAWWVADAGSTNGVRVESAQSSRPVARNDARGVELPAEAALVLSADAQGEPREYPRVSFAAAAQASAAAKRADVPATPIAPPRRGEPRSQRTLATRDFTIAAHTASGVQQATIGETVVPFGIGRSRNQGLVIDWTHVEVSGQHVEIVALDDAGASVLVHGDNGVSVEGTAYASGDRFRWLPGETLTLGRADGDVPACTLTLSATQSRASV